MTTVSGESPFVADVLDDRAVVAAYLLRHDPQHLVHEELRALGPEALPDASRVDHVGDEDGDDPNSRQIFKNGRYEFFSRYIRLFKQTSSRETVCLARRSRQCS